MAFRRPVLAVVALVLALGGGFATAQDSDADLKPVDGGFRHEPSESTFLPPAGWEVVRVKKVVESSFLGVRDGDKGIEVTLSWSPLLIKMEDMVALEVEQLGLLYGKDKVGKPEPITLHDKPGFRIRVDNGPTLNGKEAGVVYLFETGPDADSRWKVQLRATVSKRTQAESLKAVEKLLQQLRW